MAEVRKAYIEPHNLSGAYRFAEYHVVQRFGQEGIEREFLRCRYVGKFVYPFQHVAAKELAVVVEVLG